MVWEPAGLLEPMSRTVLRREGFAYGAGPMMRFWVVMKIEDVGKVDTETGDPTFFWLDMVEVFKVGEEPPIEWASEVVREFLTSGDQGEEGKGYLNEKSL